MDRVQQSRLRIAERLTWWVLCTAILFSSPGASPAGTWIPAFPGAEGYGARAVGGRGGTVIEVTNLNDSGPGSLRASIEASGPRIVVFRVGGTITLQSTLLLENPYITIAGQTAPGGGIALRNTSNFNIYEDPSATLDIRTHDVVIRHLRIRPGIGGRESDAIQIYHGTYNLILDHCSLSWAVDEVISSWWDPHDFTIQWCIISEGLRNAGHSEGAHSTGLLLGSDGCTRVSVHHNLLAHNNDRNPRIKTSGVMDIVNNVFYNFGDNAGVFSRDVGPMSINYVGNHVRTGGDSNDNYEVAVWNKAYPLALYVRDNLGPHRTDAASADNLVVEPGSRDVLVPARQPALAVVAQSPAQAFHRVIGEAGATLPERDSVDRRVAADAANGTGRIIDNPLQVGGWPDLAAGTPATDTDHDGMPDAWETLHGLKPADPSDGPTDRDGDGYTNVEEFLNGTDPGSDRACGVRLVSYGGSAPEGAVLGAAGVGRYTKSDQAHVLTSLPASHECDLLVRYAEADRQYAGANFIEIHLTADATISIGCAAGATPPGWLSGWAAAGESLTARLNGGTGETVTYDLRSRSYTGGQTVTLGGNFADGGSTPAGYIILISPGCARSTPGIHSAPQPQSAVRGGEAVLTVAAAGAGQLGYQWFKDGVALDDTGHFTGSATPRLVIGPMADADAGRYRVVVTDDWCSTAAETTVTLITPCDFDADKDVDQEDFGVFQLCLGETSAACARARLDDDQDVDQADFAVFLSCFGGQGVRAPDRCLDPPSDAAGVVRR